MAVPVARVHLKVAQAALPALLPTPPKWKKMLLPTTPPPPPPSLAPATAKPSRADADERWDAHKTKSESGSSSGPSASSSPRSAVSSAGRGSWRKNAASPPPPPKPGRADAAERWDAHKTAASPSSSAERWDVHKINRCRPAAQADLLDDGESSSTGSNDVVDTEDEEEEIVWKPRPMYAGPGFAAGVPEPRMLPLPTALFLVPAA